MSSGVSDFQRFFPKYLLNPFLVICFFDSLSTYFSLTVTLAVSLCIAHIFLNIFCKTFVTLHVTFRIYVQLNLLQTFTFLKEQFNKINLMFQFFVWSFVQFLYDIKIYIYSEYHFSILTFWNNKFWTSLENV